MAARCFPGGSLLFPSGELPGGHATCMFRYGARAPHGGTTFTRTALRRPAQRGGGKMPCPGDRMRRGSQAALAAAKAGQSRPKWSSQSRRVSGTEPMG